MSSFSVFSQDELSLTKQWSIVRKIASEQRRNLWRKGHESIRSKENLVLKLDQLEDLISASESSFRPISDEEGREIMNCAYMTSCKVFYVDVYSEYMSGYGHDRIWVLLNTVSGSTRLISESVYSE
jgi:hypothetical protein